MAQTECYLQVEPTFMRHNPDRVQSIRVVGVTQKRPRKPQGGAVIVKFNLNIADAAFEPLRPEVEIDIPADRTEAVRVDVEPLEVPE